MSWPVKRLGEVFEIARGGSPRPIDRYITEDPNGYNWIMISDAPEGAKYITNIKKRITSEGLSKTRQVKPGDFLLTNSMSFGRPYILKTAGCIHDGWLVLSPRSKDVSPDYFYYLLGSDSLKRQFIKGAAGAVVKNLNTTMVKGVTVPLPPLAEQKRIAGILDAADALRAKRREALAQLDTLLQATFLDLFGDPVTNPKGWEKIPLSTKATRVTKGGSPNWQGFSYQESGVLFVTSENVRNGYLDISSPKYVSQPFHEKLKGSQLASGDLLVNLVGASIGRSCLFTDVTSPANVNQAVGVVTFDDKVFANYVVNLLQTGQGRSMLTGRIVEAARANVSLASLRKIMIPTPTSDLQRQFSDFSIEVGQQKAQQLQHLAELDTLFASLQSRAFRGEL